MSILFRAALLGGIAYLITRSLSGNTSRGHWAGSGGSGAAPRRGLHPGENNVWPTSESQQTETANAGPTS